MPGDETDVQEDWLTYAGTDAQYKFRVQPFDGTGSTASIIIDTLGTFAMTVTATEQSGQVFTDFAVAIGNAVTTTWLAGVYAYKVFVTYTDGTVVPYGHGSVVVK